MPKFSYGQYCPIAYALDILGERWTMLVIRELMHGPRTYKSMFQNLPDMGAIKLTRRLNSLERKGVVHRQTTEPRSADELYRLTERGEKLKPILKDLAAWGLESLALPTEQEVYSPLWSLIEFQIMFKPEKADNLNMMFELRVENESFHVVIGNGTLSTHVGPASSPLFIISTDSATFIMILRGHLSLRMAIQQQRVAVDGSLAALSRTLDIFGLRSPGANSKSDRKDEDDGYPKIELYPAR